MKNVNHSIGKCVRLPLDDCDVLQSHMEYPCGDKNALLKQVGRNGIRSNLTFGV